MTRLTTIVLLVHSFDLLFYAVPGGSGRGGVLQPESVGKFLEIDLNGGFGALGHDDGHHFGLALVKVAEGGGGAGFRRHGVSDWSGLGSVGA